MEEFLTIGAVAERSGVTTSALRFYEQHGLLSSERTDGNQRRYHREVLRRVAFIRVGQQVGLSLADIRDALASLPDARTPNQRDWERLSARWRGDLDERIRLLQALRDELSSCIGCGCLTLHRCKLYNPNDGAARLGTGPRYLLGNESSEVVG
ncbi:MAG: redox-sensitive transcriptional activator SoxR [Actinobacteria bacterium]|nr:redox-sensitive transcriptional activator SoxR [Actinomycetota bacterium]MBV9662673.1 redox-sensitive transcriptional activator SoxR [Actinomycetota bacterium]